MTPLGWIVLGLAGSALFTLLTARFIRVGQGPRRDHEEEL